jgi:ATP-dependent Clp protease ATP-binding subunit ClpA
MVFSQHLLDALRQQVVGQEYAVAALTRAVTLALTRMRPQNRPVAALIFAGPTGSGKTHVARSLAQVMFGDERSVMYVNCRQVSQARDQWQNLFEQLVAGYWQISTRHPLYGLPFIILVFEEIDKAPSELRENIAAGIERGGLLAKGLFFSLRDTLIIMTTTLSKKQTDQLVGRTIGFFSEGEPESETRGQHVLALEEMDRIVGGHLVGRSDEIILFERLTPEHLGLLLDRKLANVERHLGILRVSFVVDRSARSFLLNSGTEDLAHGVRQINRAVRNLIEFPLADLMLSGRIGAGTGVHLSHQPPRSFLNFQIAVPAVLPAHMPVAKPLELAQESI